MSDLTQGQRRGGIDDECRADLLAAEQRGQLSDANRLALQAHLADCASCRHARRVFADFADVSGVDPQDGATIERMSNAARRWTHRHSHRAVRSFRGRKRPRALALAAWVLFLGATASAAAWLLRHPPALDPRVTISAVAPGSETERRLDGRVHDPAALAPTEQVTAEALGNPGDPAAAARGAVDRSARPPSRQATRGASDRGAVTAASLLRQASDARREGDDERAIHLYRNLQGDFPDSAEAVLASVPVGGLLLQRKAPGAALAAFDAYLGSSRGGALIPEALYGRGRALAQLGDRQEERRNWERLLADFPESAYGPFAQRRLAELK